MLSYFIPQYKVRPGPDPERPDKTTWMSKQELHDESLKESKEWIDSGTGSLGYLFVEVIACDELPNLDTGGFVGNKTGMINRCALFLCCLRDVLHVCLNALFPWCRCFCVLGFRRQLR
jgi:hypothetical protein